MQTWCLITIELLADLDCLKTSYVEQIIEELLEYEDCLKRACSGNCWNA